MIRRYGDAPKRGHRYKVRHGAYAVLPLNGQVLCTWQGGIENEHGKTRDEVQLPGGGIDPGESPVQALHREVFEETGWRIGTPRRLGAFRRFTYMPEYDKWAEKVCHIYTARPVLRLGPPTEPEHEAIWLPLREAVMAVYNDGDADFAARFLSQTPRRR